MEVRYLFARAREQLKTAGIPFPAQEARLLLAETLGVPLAWVMAHPEALPSPGQEELFAHRVERRLRYEPMAYLLGHREFYGLDFLVSSAVLIPRSETELLVERALAACQQLTRRKHHPLLAADLGTGSGAVAVALAVHQPGLRLVAIDISEEALAVARENAARHAVSDRIDFRHGDLLEPVSEQMDLLVANLPYIPSGETGALMADVRDFEPKVALDGGKDGTLLTRRALEQAVNRMRRPASLLFEIGDGQGKRLAATSRELYPDATIRVLRDYAGFERVLSVDLE